MRRLVGLSGALMIAAALVVLGSIAWQLWGTGIATAQAQHRLAKQLRAEVSSAPATPSAFTSSTAPSAEAAGADVLPGAPPMRPSPALGTLVGRLAIPEIGVDDYVVEGVGAPQLAEGPGHYPGTAPIGGNGNVGIAGHRTTHGAPFYNLNELHPGDLIYLTNTAGESFTYRVVSQFIVQPSDAAVLNSTATRSLTLTTCNPRYSASQRLIVRATLMP